MVEMIQFFWNESKGEVTLVLQPEVSIYNVAELKNKIVQLTETQASQRKIEVNNPEMIDFGVFQLLKYCKIGFPEMIVDLKLSEENKTLVKNAGFVF